jgi:hypothetical protein
MFDVDLDRLKVLKPWRDGSFWVALLWSAAMLGSMLAPDAARWVKEHQAALIAASGPLTAWLVLHGIIRARSVKGTAYVMAAQVEREAAADDLQAAQIEAAEPAGVTHVTQTFTEPAGNQ